MVGLEAYLAVLPTEKLFICQKLETQKMQVQSQGQEDPLEKETATHSSILAWRIPWTEEPGVAKSRTRLSDFTHYGGSQVVLTRQCRIQET